MNDDRLTPEERAVIDAAQACLDVFTSVPGHWAPLADALADALAAYRKATAPPEPFERYLYRYTDGSWSFRTFDDVDDTEEFVGTWRCTITPVERVR